MSEIDHTQSNALISALEELVSTNDTKSETSGTVTRVDASGTAWVRFKGADADTPCVRTTATVSAGDSVSVSIVSHRACVTGNFTSPASDDSTARVALGNASQALQAANIAGASARSAAADAKAAHVSAESAKTSAESAHESAEYARAEAKDAISNALAALAQLGTVEDVMGTLAWIKDHEVFVPATSFEASETYYVLQGGKYVEVDSPTADDIDSYYVYDHESTMANFLQEHLTLTQRGLYITQSRPEQYKPTDADYEGNEGNIRPPGTGYMLLSGENIIVYGASGHPLAMYGGSGVELLDGETDKRIAWIENQALHVYRAELQGELAINNWVWMQRESGNISFRWRE